MRRQKRESPLSEGARDLRGATRTAAFFGLAFLCGAFAAFKGWILSTLAPPFLSLSAAATLTALWLGIKTHRKALEDRDKESGSAMLIAIAVQLGKQDDASLEAIKAKGGPAGEAAGLILQGRSEKLKKVRGEG